MATASDALRSLVVQVQGLDIKDNEIGSGAYGMVHAVIVNGRRCIAKSLHPILLQADNYLPNATTQQRSAIEAKFRTECVILSALNHPNVVEFVGVHYGRDRTHLSLIMERLSTDLNAFLERNPTTRLPVRLSILADVSCGLRYLHQLQPPLIHRDLTAPNILLTEDSLAKIGDLGVSRFVDPNVATTLTVGPGNIVYMPPEAHYKNPSYTIKLDIFSYGVLILHTVIGKIPEVYTLPQDDDHTRQLVREGKVELMRRDEAVHTLMGDKHCLYPLVVRCLRDNPDNRPTTEEVHSSLRELCGRYPKEVRSCFHFLVAAVDMCSLLQTSLFILCLLYN